MFLFCIAVRGGVRQQPLFPILFTHILTIRTGVSSPTGVSPHVIVAEGSRAQLDRTFAAAVLCIITREVAAPCSSYYKVRVPYLEPPVVVGVPRGIATGFFLRSTVDPPTVRQRSSGPTIFGIPYFSRSDYLLSKGGCVTITLQRSRCPVLSITEHNRYKTVTIGSIS